jgi:hypothetical protein
MVIQSIKEYSIPKDVKDLDTIINKVSESFASIKIDIDVQILKQLYTQANQSMCTAEYNFVQNNVKYHIECTKEADIIVFYLGKYVEEYTTERLGRR